MKNKLDLAGTILSIGCLIHCLFFPLIIPMLSFIGFIFTHDYWFHFVMAGIVTVVGLLAFALGYKKHKSIEPFLGGISGISLLLIAGFNEITNTHWINYIVTIMGGTIMILSHYRNHKLLCFCKHHEEKECH